MARHPSPWRSWPALLLAAGLGALAPTPGGDGSLSWSEAEAIIGRPLTPMSYAGVARRTTRRAVVAGAAVSTYPYPAYGYGGYPPGYVATLPSGCVQTVVGGVVAFNCAGVLYRPVYDGPHVAYVPM